MAHRKSFTPLKPIIGTLPATALCDRCSGFGANLLVGSLDPNHAPVGFCGSLDRFVQSPLLSI